MYMHSPSLSSNIPEPSEPMSDVYHSAEIFRVNYAEMERKFKIYVYRDGDSKTFYHMPMECFLIKKHIYLKLNLDSQD